MDLTRRILLGAGVEPLKVTLKQRNGIWNVHYYQDGKRIRKSLGQGTNKRQAEQFAQRIRKSLIEGELGLPSLIRTTEMLRPLAAEYVEFLRANGGKHGGGVSEHHLGRVKTHLEDYLDTSGVLFLAQLSAESGENWLNEVAQRDPQSGHARYRDKGLSARSVNKRRAALRAWGAWLTTEEGGRRLPYNPFQSLKARRGDIRHEHRLLEEPEFLAVLRAAPEYRQLFYLFLARTGLRYAEAGKVRWGDLNLGEEPSLAVRASVSSKNMRRTTIPLNAVLAAMLRLWRDRKLELGHYSRYPQVADSGRGLEHQVFPKSPARRTWKRDLEKANVPYETAAGFAGFHGHRVKFCVELSDQAETSLPLVQRLMRHSTPNLTANTYYRIRKGRDRDAINRLGQVS